MSKADTLFRRQPRRNYQDRHLLSAPPTSASDVVGGSKCPESAKLDSLLLMVAQRRFLSSKTHTVDQRGDAPGPAIRHAVKRRAGGCPFVRRRM